MLSLELVRWRFGGLLFSSLVVSSPVLSLLLLVLLLLFLLGSLGVVLTLEPVSLTFEACAVVVEESDGGRPPTRPVFFFYCSQIWSSTSSTEAAPTTTSTIREEATMNFVRKSLCCLLNEFYSFCNGWVLGTYRRVEEMQLIRCLINCTFKSGKEEWREFQRCCRFN